METIANKVRHFMEVFGHEVRESPSWAPTRIRKLWMKLIHEELEELEDAIDDGDLIEVADGGGDLLYVVNGFLWAHGIDPDGITAEIHRSNMEKLGPDGKPIVREEDGKILKPEGWEPPDIRGALRSMGWKEKRLSNFVSRHVGDRETISFLYEVNERTVEVHNATVDEFVFGEGGRIERVALSADSVTPKHGFPPGTEKAPKCFRIALEGADIPSEVEGFVIRQVDEKNTGIDKLSMGEVLEQIVEGYSTSIDSAVAEGIVDEDDMAHERALLRHARKLLGR